VARDAGWVSAHLFYHGHLDLLLVDLVAPLTEELAAAGTCDRYFFLRYWDGGPHVRLRLHAPVAVHGQVAVRVERAAARFFRERPSRDALDPAVYLAEARRLARREGMRRYTRRPYPNNSVALIPYRPEYARYGPGPAIRAVERHFVESSAIAIGLLRSGASAGQRDTAALCLLMLTWHRAGFDHSRLTPASSDLDDVPDVEQRYLRQRDTVRALADRMQAVASGAGGDGALAMWRDSLDRLRAALGDSPATMRILDTCAHLVCNRLGVGPTSEAYLRYLASRSAG